MGKAKRKVSQIGEEAALAPISKKSKRSQEGGKKTNSESKPRYIPGELAKILDSLSTGTGEETGNVKGIGDDCGRGSVSAKVSRRKITEVEIPSDADTTRLEGAPETSAAVLRLFASVGSEPTRATLHRRVAEERARAEKKREQRKRKQKEEKSKAKGDVKLQAAAKVEEDERTVFLGNVPLSAKRADIRRFLGIEKTQLESIRFRSLPVLEKWSNNKRVGIARKEFADSASVNNVYVVLQTKELAKEAIANKNGASIGANIIRVNAAGSRGNAGDSTGKFSVFDPRRSLFVGNMPFTMTEEGLNALGETVGPVEAVRIIHDAKSSRSKGFGFILFIDKFHVSRALQQLSGYECEGRLLKVTRTMDEERAKRMQNAKSAQKRKENGARGLHPSEVRFLQKMIDKKARSKKSLRRS